MSEHLRINGDPVKLVESFDELREGMIVWVRPCGACLGQHRQILAGRYSGPIYSGTKGVTEDSGFVGHPNPPCCRAPFRVTTPHSVSRRIVYRVVDDDLTEVSRQVVRKKERIR